MSSRKLDALKESLAARNTQALLVIRDDRIVTEWYAPGHSATKRHYTASLAKAIVGGVSLAVAMDDGRIALDDPAAKYIPQWKGDPRKSRITIRQLGSHTSGLADAEAEGKPHEELTGWKGDFWKRLDPPNDPFTISRDLAPVLFEPGTRPAVQQPGHRDADLRRHRRAEGRAGEGHPHAAARAGHAAHRRARRRNGRAATARPSPWTGCRWSARGAAATTRHARRPASAG